MTSDSAEGDQFQSRGTTGPRVGNLMYGNAAWTVRDNLGRIATD